MHNHPFLALVIMALVTAALRSVPFIWRRFGKELPKKAESLLKKLPYASMAMLVVYCLKDTRVTAFPYGLPEGIACLVTAGLHIWKRNTLLSIACGTAVYALLVQTVFAL